MTELKPCPFCGGEAKVSTLKWGGGYTATALCKNEPNAHYLNTWDEDETKAVERITEAWNRRDEEACRAELANRYIELPLDADGVPIHIGDVLNSDEYMGRQFPCRGMSVDVHGGKHWTVCMDYDSYSGTSEWCAASRCHHVR